MVSATRRRVAATAGSCGGACCGGGTVCATSSSSAFRSNGFSKYPSAPYRAVMVAATVPPLCTPDMKMKGILRRVSISATSKPIRSGSSTSTTASSGFSRRARSIALLPRSALETR